jgi:arsenate reductase
VPAREQNLHQSFDDPSAATGSETDQLAVFRRVRDEIADWIDTVFGPSA